MAVFAGFTADLFSVVDMFFGSFAEKGVIGVIDDLFGYILNVFLLTLN